MTRKQRDRLLLQAAEEASHFSDIELERLVCAARFLWGDFNDCLEQQHVRHLTDLLSGGHTKYEKAVVTLGNQVGKLLQQTKHVDAQINIVRTEDVSKIDLNRYQKDLHFFLHDKKKFFQMGDNSKALQFAYGVACMIQDKINIKWRQREDKRWSLLKVQEDMTVKRATYIFAESKDEKERQKRLRRKLQQKLAGHPSARNLQFHKVKISDHAQERWKHRGPRVPLPTFLQAIDDGKLLYKLQPTDAKGGSTVWEVSINHKDDRRGGVEVLLVLLLNNSMNTLITILRDDDYYNYNNEKRAANRRKKKKKPFSSSLSKSCNQPRSKKSNPKGPKQGKSKGSRRTAKS